MKSKILLLFAIAAVSCQLGYAQAWSGILDPSRATDWTQAGIPGGIPNRTTVCQTVAPSGQTNATDATNIQNAIAACSGTNEVVQLEAGTYTISQGLTFGNAKNVTLRGQGPDKTKLVFTGVISCGTHADVCIMGSSGWAGNYPGSTAWTAGYNKGATLITVASTTGLSVGQIIALDQRDDAIGVAASPSGATESGSTVTITTSIPHGYKVGQSVGVGCVGSSSDSCNATTSGYDGVYTITAVPTSTTFQYADPNTGLAASGGGQATVDTGGVYSSCVGGPTCSDESGAGLPDIGRTCPDNLQGPGSQSGVNQCQPGEISFREQTEFKQITAINGNQLTINPPLEMPNWRASQSPGVWWLGNYATGDGVESMTLDYTNDGGASYRTGGIVFYNAYECWAKNIRSIEGNRNHVWIQQSARIDVEDNYFWGTKGGHSQSYGVELYNGDSDNLVQNNICQHVVDCVMAAGDWGSVFSYNYMVDSGYNTTDWLMGMLNENHDFTGYELFEGNDADASVNDDIHGSSTAATNFRNRLRGQDTPAKSNDLNAVQDNSFNRFVNFVGNVVGTPGAETTYQITMAGYRGSGTSDFDLGAESDNGGTPNDPLTTSSALRWGNYDVASGTTRWCGNSSDTGWSATCASTSEIPTTTFAYMNGNAVPANTTLPNSFYLSSQPAFWQTAWGTPPWPAIGPDVTGGTAPDGLAGHSYALPAQVCYMNTPVDSSYQQTFPVTGANWSSGTATLTTSNSLVANDTVTVSGVSPSAYNGTFAVTGATSTTISYALPNNPGIYSSGGSINYPNILLFNAANCYPAEYSASSVQPPTGLSATPH